MGYSCTKDQKIVFTAFVQPDATELQASGNLTVKVDLQYGVALHGVT